MFEKKESSTQELRERVKNIDQQIERLEEDLESVSKKYRYQSGNEETSLDEEYKIRNRIDTKIDELKAEKESLEKRLNENEGFSKEAEGPKGPAL